MYQRKPDPEPVARAATPLPRPVPVPVTATDRDVARLLGLDVSWPCLFCGATHDAHAHRTGEAVGARAVWEA